MGKFQMKWSNDVYDVIHKICEELCGDEFHIHVTVNPNQLYIGDVFLDQKTEEKYGVFHIHLPEFELMSDEARKFLLDTRIKDIREAIRNADV